MKNIIIKISAAILVLLPIACLAGLILNYFAILPNGISQLWFLIPMVAEGVLIAGVVFLFALIGVKSEENIIN